MKVTTVPPTPPSPDIQITMSLAEATLLRKHLFTLSLRDWEDFAVAMGFPTSVGDELNGLYYHLCDIPAYSYSK